MTAFATMTTAQAQKVVHDDYNRLQVEFTTGELKVGEATMGGETYSTLSIEGYLSPSEVGFPSLPVYSRLVEVPLCDGFEVEVTDAVYDTIEATQIGLRHPVIPVQPSRSKSDTMRHTPVVGMDYSVDAYCGTPTAQVEEAGVARDRRLARLQYSPVRYNPVTGTFIICRQATVTVYYTGADREATLTMFERYHSPAFGGTPVLNSLYPKSVSTTAPVRYLIVANSMFRGQLDTFVEWKRRKGYLTDIVYTDSAAVGTTTTSIQAFIQSQYNDATATCPAPTYLLLVGDHEQLPAFTGTTNNNHITDLYYTTWSAGDNLPDCYCGRFSAQSISQLTPQVQKTLMYEQYTFADPSFLDRAVMVAGVDGGSDGDYGYTHADPAMDYAITHYVNGSQGFSQVRYFKNNTSVVPTGSNVTVDGNSYDNSATVRGYYNQGAGFINYSAHGSATSWGTPNFTTTHVASMTNTQKFGLMIGNCCLTNKFQTSACLGEALLRKGNYCGAVGYIGGSNSTYWGEDFYWAVGVRSSISATMSLAYNANNLGAYDRLCHTHGESYSQWAITQGGLMFQGNMAVQGSTSSMKLYYWEIYHLMGDPSVMPYMTQANEMTISVLASIPIGSTSLTVTAVPYAYVALTDSITHTLVAATWADSVGSATLTLPASLTMGTYELAVSAQQYQTHIRTVTVMQPTGIYAYTTAVSTDGAPAAGTTVPLTLTIANPGDSTAHNVTLHFSSDNGALTFSADSLTIDSVAAGATVLVDSMIYATVSTDATDGSMAVVSVSTSWNGNNEPIVTSFRIGLQAPVLITRFGVDDLYLLPGQSGTVSVTLSNQGHATSAASSLVLTSPTQLLTVSATDTSSFTVPVGTTITHTFVVQSDTSLPTHIQVPLRLTLVGAPMLLDTVVSLVTAASNIESFEEGRYHAGSWSTGSFPWVFDTATTYNGGYSFRSTASLTHYQTAEATVTHTFATADSISFHYKVSSETNYDKFHFLIDGADMLTVSGDVDWTRATYAVGAGSHTFKFTYEKDGSVNRGSDCAWVDDIVFPLALESVQFRNDTLCAGSVYIPFGDTINTQEAGSGVVQGTEGGTATIVDYLVLPTYNVTDSIEANGSYTWNDSVYTVSGTYTQVFNSAYGCDSTVNLVLTVIDTIPDTVGIDMRQAESAEWKAWPNPTSGKVVLDRCADEVRLYDALGRQLALLHNVREMDLESLPQGVYYAIVRDRWSEARLRVIRL